MFSSMGADGYRVQRIVMMGFDPKKYMEMLRRNPELEARKEYEFSSPTSDHDQRDRHQRRDAVSRLHRGTEMSEDVGLQGASPNNFAGESQQSEAEEGRFLSTRLRTIAA